MIEIQRRENDELGSAYGNLAAEYGSSSPNPCDTATCYVTVDHLGTTRMVTDANGLVVNTDGSIAGSRYDYLPFGSQIFANYGGRTAAMGYYTMGTPDGMNPKFTGQMRDQETTLDWFNVRHMSGAQGRFQSVDPGNAGADPSDPQTWNMYAYVGNNPLSYTDPSGQFVLAGGGLGTFLGLGAETGPAGWIFDAGLAAIGLFELFDHGGGGPPPLANSPFPNQAPTSTPSGGPLGPGNGDSWNQQAPFGSPVGTGGLFGGGNTSPFVFSYTSTQTMPWPTTWPQIPGWTGLWPALGSGARAAVIVGARALGLGLALISTPVTANQDEIFFFKAPGKPTAADGYTPPKRGAGARGETVRNPNGPGRGWVDDKGNVWAPTGEGPTAHGGPHWDVQRPDGTHVNVYPGGRTR